MYVYIYSYIHIYIHTCIKFTEASNYWKGGSPTAVQTPFIVMVRDCACALHVHVYLCVYARAHTQVTCTYIVTLCILQHTAKHCNTLQHTATHRNTLQHTQVTCARRLSLALSLSLSLSLSLLLSQTFLKQAPQHF